MAKNINSNLKFLGNTIKRKKSIYARKCQEIFIKNKKKYPTKDPSWFVETYFSLRGWINDSFSFYKNQFENSKLKYNWRLIDTLIVVAIDVVKSVLSVFYHQLLVINL
jgi:hypothetical protein